jgi:hypothetical protein
MRRLSHLLAVLLVVAGGFTPAVGQFPRFEIGGFGTFTRFEDALLLQDRIGGGGRLAFHFSKAFAFELDAAYLGPSVLAGNASYGAHLGSASLMIGGGSRAFSLYALGGYSRLDMGTTAPYDYAENGFHGGVGFRIGLGQRLAIRAEGRALFMPDDNLLGEQAMHLTASAGLSFFTRPWSRPTERETEPVIPPMIATPDQEQPEDAPADAPDEPRPVRARVRTQRAMQLRRSSQLLPHAEQIEVSLFGSFTRYDHMFALDNQVGGGLRVGYFLSDRLNLELEGGYSSPTDSTGTFGATLSLGSASLGLNFPMGRASLYLLGGYTRATWGEGYDFADNMVHGALGARIFLTNSLALRLEGRALYSPETNGPPPWAGHVIGSAGLSFLASPPRQITQGGVGGRSYNWYWGGQGGMFFYKTNLLPYYYEPLVGGHWMITAKRTALYVGYEQAFFLTDADAAIFDPSAEATGRFRNVTFSDMRRIMFGVLAHPAQKVIEPFGGLGFAMMQVLDPIPDCSLDCETISKSTEAFNRAEDAASKAFFWLMAGIQMNYSNRLNVFGHYILTSSGGGFLIDGNTHTIQGGIRYSFGTAKEGLTERN